MLIRPNFLFTNLKITNIMEVLNEIKLDTWHLDNLEKYFLNLFFKKKKTYFKSYIIHLNT